MSWMDFRPSQSAQGYILATIFMLIYFALVFPLASIVESVNQTHTRGDIAILMCNSLGGPANMYQWQANNTDISGETMKNLTLAVVDASTGGMYTCVVTNAAGSDSDSTFLFIAPYFIIEPVNVETANGSLVTLQCVAEAFPSPNYQWARTDGEPIREVLGTGENTFIFNPVIFGDEGDYYCNATSRNETERSQDATLTGKDNIL